MTLPRRDYGREHDALGVTREAYDAAATTYAQLFRDELRDRPLDRAILSAFAEVVSARDGQVVLAPGGHLLLSFSASDDPSHPTQVFDHAVAPAYRWWPDHLAAMLRQSGLAEVARMVREAQPTDRRQFQEIHLLARKA